MKKSAEEPHEEPQNGMKNRRAALRTAEPHEERFRRQNGSADRSYHFTAKGYKMQLI